MQLPVSGHPLHTRSLTVVVRQRDDGRWDVQGDVIDLRKCSFVPMVSDIQPAGIIHNMTIRLCFDPGKRSIDALEVEQPVVAIEPSDATGGECCRDPAPVLASFVGQTVDRGFASKLSAGFGGALGCTHLLTLFQLMASLLERAVDLEADLLREAGMAREPGENLLRRAVFVDGHELEDGSIEMAIQLAEFHTRPRAVVTQFLEQLARQYEIRVYGRLEIPGRGVVGLRAAERERVGETLLDASWVDRSELLIPFENAPVVRGFAGQILEAFGDAPETRLLRDAMLQLAPGYIQVVAAVTERWFAKRSEDAAGVAKSAEEKAVTPPLGGMPNSCYMWRADGPMLGARQALQKASEESK